MNQARDKLKLSAILSADVVGYSRLMEVDRAWTIKHLEENKYLISDLVEEYKGRVVDSPGDNLLAEFNSITNAVECAVKIQKELKKNNSKLMEDHRMEFRIGINLGEVFEENGRIYGSGVNIAARIEGLSKSGGICISGRTYDHVKTEFDFGYEYLGEHNVKNISEPIRVYRLLMDSENTGKVIGEKKAPSRSSYRLAMAAVIILIFVAAVSIGVNIYSHKTDKVETVTEQASASINEKETPKSIAVLPFEDYSPEKDQEYFVNGLSEEILNTITQISDLYVTGRTSSFSFKDSNKTTQEISEILGVENILEGSVRKVGNILRITAQLIRSKDGFHLWSKSYDKELKDVLDILNIQEDIAVAVANELKLTLNVGNSFRQLGSTNDVKAYEYYLIGREQAFNLNHEGGIELLNKAIELDPEFALAWVLKSSFHLTIASWSPPDQALLEINKATEAAHKAIEIEPRLGSAYASLASVHMTRGKFIEAELALQKGIELMPESIYQSGPILQYTALGYSKKCKKILEEMILKEPMDPVIRGAYMLNLGYLGDMEGAEKEYEHCKTLLGDQWETYGNFNITVLRLGSKEILLNKGMPDVPVFGPAWNRIKEYLQTPDEGLKYIYQLLNSVEKKDSALLRNTALFASYFGDQEGALNSIEKAAKIQTSYTLFFIWAPVFHEVRQLPRFKEFVREIGLVDYWKDYGWPDLCHPTGDDDFECD